MPDPQQTGVPDGWEVVTAGAMPSGGSNPRAPRPFIATSREEEQPGTIAKLNTALQPLAHPQTMGDMLPMLNVTGVPVAALAAGAGAMTGKALQSVGNVVSKVGNSRAAPVVSGYAALQALEHGDLAKAALAIGVPKAVQLAGRGIQTLGDFLAPIIQAAPKMKISAGDFLKVRGLMDQGIDEATALKAVFAAKAGATRVP